MSLKSVVTFFFKGQRKCVDGSKKEADLAWSSVGGDNDELKFEL